MTTRMHTTDSAGFPQRVPLKGAEEPCQISHQFASDRLVWGSEEEFPLVCARLFRLFFPLTLLRASRGWIVGWELRDGTAVACGVIPGMPPRLVGTFLAQLNSRLLKPSRPGATNTKASCNTSCSNSCSTSCSRKCADGGCSCCYVGRDPDGSFAFDCRVLPQGVELLGWWRGAECPSACPYDKTAELQQVMQATQQYQRQEEAPEFTGLERRRAWLDLCLDETSGLPFPLSLDSFSQTTEVAAATRGVAFEAEATKAADVSAENGPSAALAAPPPAERFCAAASSRCIVFLFNLPLWVSCSTLAAAPHDAAQASAAAAFVQRPAAARALLRQASQVVGAGGQQQQQQQQQRDLLLQQPNCSSEPHCSLEAVLALLNVSAAVYFSVQQQLECWRELQLQQHAAADGLSIDSSSSVAALSSDNCRSYMQQHQQRLDCRSFLYRWTAVGGSCLLRFMRCLFFSAVCFCGNVSRYVCQMPIWGLFSVVNGMWSLVASLQQMVLRLQTFAAWPEALSSSRRFSAALQAAESGEKQQQRQQVDAAAAKGELQLLAADVLPLEPSQPPLQRTYLPKTFSLSALCLYGGIVAVLVDLLLGLFLPQLLAMLIYHVIPPDACSSFSLSLGKQPGTSEQPLPPLFPISFNETVAPQLCPEPSEMQQQKQDETADALLQEHYKQHKQFQQHPPVQCPNETLKESPPSHVERKCCRRNDCRKETKCASPAAARASTRAPSATSLFHMSWRELMVQPTSSVLVDLFSACYCFLHVHLLTSHVQWLMDFPAGLKLNVNLTRVLGSVILTAIHLWNDLTSYLHSAIIYAEQVKWGVYENMEMAAVGETQGVLSGLTLLKSLKDAAARGMRGLYHLLASSGAHSFPSKAPAPSRDGSSSSSSISCKRDCKSSNSSSSRSSGGVWEMWGEFVAWGIWLWDSCRLCLKAGLGTLLTTFRLGWLGLSASMFVAASADLLMIVTLHIFYVYLVCARLLHVNLKSLHSLFLLFRGQKWNVLRRRVDSADLQVDQLLIGCILFTITVCLFPTTLIFYVSYLLIWLLIFCTQSLLRLALLLFFSFPTYLIALRAFFPHLFAAGVSFEPIHSLPCGHSIHRPHIGDCRQLMQSFQWRKKTIMASAATAAAAPATQCRDGWCDASGRSSSSIYFLLYARPVSLGEIIWPPLRAAARATLSPLRASALLPKILSGKIVSLSRYDSAWPHPSPSEGEI